MGGRCLPEGGVGPPPGSMLSTSAFPGGVARRGRGAASWEALQNTGQGSSVRASSGAGLMPCMDCGGERPTAVDHCLALAPSPAFLSAREARSTGPWSSEPPVWDPAQGHGHSNQAQLCPKSYLVTLPQLQMWQEAQGWGTLRKSTEPTGGYACLPAPRPRTPDPLLCARGCPSAQAVPSWQGQFPQSLDQPGSRTAPGSKAPIKTLESEKGGNAGPVGGTR